MKLEVSKEFKIGIFSLVSGVVLYLGFNYLKGADMFSDSYRIHAVFEDVQGLVISSPVLLNGLNIGRVSDMQLAAGATRGNVVATLEIDNKDVVIAQGTTCTLVSTDLLGGKALRINPPKLPGEALAERDTIPAYIEQDFTKQIGAKIDPMLQNLDSVSAEVKVLLRSFGQTQTILEGTMLSFKGTADATSSLLSSNKGNITVIAGNLAKLSGELTTTQKQLTGMLTKYSQFGDSLNRMKLATTVANLNKSIEGLNGVLRDVNAGKGSLGKLTKNDSLYANLNRSTESLDALLKDMKARPNRYIHFSVFGKKVKE
jgi:phospholipid/cholesterol/gamma-HCH transport system substrate-binding protein